MYLVKHDRLFQLFSDSHIVDHFSPKTRNGLNTEQSVSTIPNQIEVLLKWNGSQSKNILKFETLTESLTELQSMRKYSNSVTHVSILFWFLTISSVRIFYFMVIFWK